MNTVEPIRDTKKLAAMKKILKGGNLRDYFLFTLGINTGCRISDLLNLTVADVAGKDFLTIREKKTGKEKRFQLNDTVKQALKEYNPAGYCLFPSREGGTLTRQRAYGILNDAARLAGIKDKIGTHTLRKTFGYHARKKGVAIEILQKVFNHSSPGITMRYIGITQDEIDEVYLNLNL
jgi:integrase